MSRASPGKAIWSLSSKAMVKGYLSSLELTSCHHMPQSLVIKIQDLVFVLLGFGLALLPSLLSIPLFFPFGMGMLALYHCMLEL
jgi:hypothetical protein